MGSLKRQSTLASMTPKQRRIYKLYRFSIFAFNELRRVTLYLLELFWRFLELYLHKIVCLLLFATAISQISVAYWALLVFMLVLVVPFPYINPLTFPIVTLYLGLLSIVKMVYQLPVIMEGRFDFVPASVKCVSAAVSHRAALGPSAMEPLFL